MRWREVTERPPCAQPELLFATGCLRW